MHRLKICVSTGSRSEFGQLLPLLKRLDNDPFFDLNLVVTGSHLTMNSGNTIEEIREEGLEISEEIYIRSMEGEASQSIALQISEVIARFAAYFEMNAPDCLLAIGDRYEMFGICIAASGFAIPICHIAGGSVTSGALDEYYRHSITKMSSLHFATCEAYRKRIIQLGENPKTVYNVGSLAIENCYSVKVLPKNDLLAQLGMDRSKPYCVVTYHPVTLNENPVDGLKELIEALDDNERYQYLITFANTDFGGRQINEMWSEAERLRTNFVLVSSLGFVRYLSALKYAEMMIGNSSSGTTEGPAMRIPVINIGDRQKGRIFSAATIHCKPIAAEISSAIKKAGSAEFKELARNTGSLFGDGKTSCKIVDIMKKKFLHSIPQKEPFYDVKFECK